VLDLLWLADYLPMVLLEGVPGIAGGRGRGAVAAASVKENCNLGVLEIYPKLEVGREEQGGQPEVGTHPQLRSTKRRSGLGPVACLLFVGEGGGGDEVVCAPSYTTEVSASQPEPCMWQRWLGDLAQVHSSVKPGKRVAASGQLFASHRGGGGGRSCMLLPISVEYSDFCEVLP